MRATPLLLALALLAAAGTGLAGHHDAATSHHGGHGGDHAPDDATNASAKAEAAKARRAELQGAREAALASFHENRTRILEEYRETVNLTRATFLAEKEVVLEACAAERDAFENNSGYDEPPAHAKCVSDGLRPLIEAARADLAEAREHALEELKALRASTLHAWNEARAAAHARHGGPDDA